MNCHVNDKATYNTGDYSNLNNNNEPLDIHDWIEYYHPNAVCGNKEALRRACVLNINTSSLGGSMFWLELSNGDLLPEDHRIKRITGKPGEVIIGTYRELQRFYMKHNMDMNSNTVGSNNISHTQTVLNGFINKKQK